jgi:bifunctional DNA-binding transcriptional regulator/antitoxin component of YhaV-PrlF toxin-antitoxin module
MPLSAKKLVVPVEIQRKAGIEPGDHLEFKVSRRKITILASAEKDEYTPKERRAINARLARARKGPYYGPFNSVREAMAFVEKGTKRPSRAKRPRSG